MSNFSTVRMVKDAISRGYAVPAINVVDPLSLKAVTEAGQRIQSPLIVQTSVKTVRLFGARTLAAAFVEATEEAITPVTLHLDHCPDRDVITECIEAGWDSVLFDASDRDLDLAFSETEAVVAEAHAEEVEVESEIENIIGVEDGVGSDEAMHAYSVDTLLRVATKSNVDLLAPALGTSHGVYTSKPKLLPDRASEIARRTEIPIVLHGGTGLTESQFRSFIDAGIGKINVSTALKQAYMKAGLAYLQDEALETDQWEPMGLFDAQATACSGIVEEFATIFGSVGRG
ncbi:class II fructose-bisphosphate aldolase [Actinomycetaceae bacterium MB13-C1-2]|nr:class II fructose-bisphosphate aldolase [Actinomycetaceae bacterium MB13-C1-2]